MLKQKIIVINENIEIFFSIRKEFHYVVCRKKNSDLRFFKTPKNVYLEWINTQEKRALKIFFVDGQSSHLEFLLKLENYLSSDNSAHKVKLVVKGTGYKISFHDALQSIELKLGYSHLCLISIPKDKIKVSITKNVIRLEGIDKSFLGNFCNELLKLKYPDPYKEKGICLKNKKYILKTIKKK